MIGSKAYDESRVEKRCPHCNGVLLAATVENAKWVAEYRDNPTSYPQVLTGMRRKRFCCSNCSSPSYYEEHSRTCTLKSQNPKEKEVVA
jgi:ribosomal protein S27AE